MLEVPSPLSYDCLPADSEIRSRRGLRSLESTGRLDRRLHRRAHGMGGGALMTPILVLLFGIDPGTAVSSDLLASLVMKPVGATVHFRRGTVNWPLAPVARAGIGACGVRRRLRAQRTRQWRRSGEANQDVARVGAHRGRHLDGRPCVPRSAGAGSFETARYRGHRNRGTVQVKRVATMLIGLAGGFIVG